MITKKELNKIRSKIAIIGIGAKKELAKFMDINPSNVTRYLKHGEIPEERLDQINSFIERKLE